MSQTIVSDKIPKRGKDIEEYLGSRYSEPWFSKTRRSEKDEEYEITFCPYCHQLLEKPSGNQDTMELEQNVKHVQ